MTKEYLSSLRSFDDLENEKLENIKNVPLTFANQVGNLSKLKGSCFGCDMDWWWGIEFRSLSLELTSLKLGGSRSFWVACPPPPLSLS